MPWGGRSQCDMAALSARLCLVVVVVALAVALTGGPSGATELSLEKFQHRTKLHERFLLSWNVNSSYIVFKMEVQTAGYVGFGVSRKGGMKDTDMVVCGADHVGGDYTCTDRYSASETTPVKDNSQDVHIYSLNLVNQHRVVTFGRKLKTGDKHDVDITHDTMRAVFAFGSDVVIVHHGANRGTKSVLLLSYSSGRDEVLEPSTTADLLTSNFKIPSDKNTFYLCTMFKLPVLTKKHHLIKVEAVVTNGSEPYVHHMILYRCAANINGSDKQQNQCYHPNMPEPFWKCQGITVAWAIGGEAFVYPKDVGYSLGTDGDPQYVLLEIHYDNPNLATGVVDNSGFRLFYTNKLRKYDAGIVEVGVDPSPYHIIPPHVSGFVSHGLCTTALLQDGHVSRVYVFAALLHAHLAGRKIHVRHFRAGKEIGSIGEDNTYDFNFQESRYFPQHIEVIAGDVLVVECTYDTEERKNITTGGFETLQEMCLAYLHYYPRVSLARCRSIPNVPTLARNLLGCEVTKQSNKYRVTSPERHKGRLLEAVVAEFAWSTDRVAQYERLLRDTDYDVKLYLSKNHTWLYETAKLPGARSVGSRDDAGSRGDAGRPCPWRLGFELLTVAVALLLL